jgi:hypothetical protein
LIRHFYSLNIQFKTASALQRHSLNTFEAWLRVKVSKIYGEKHFAYGKNTPGTLMERISGGKDMRWWFQRKKAETTGRDVTNSPSERPLVSCQAVSLPRGEQLVLLRRAWEHYVELRDGLPGVVQRTAKGFNDIASMVSIIVDDPTARPIIYSNTQPNPNSLKVGGEHIEDIDASLGTCGVSFSHAGNDYFTDASNATGNMLGLLDSLWPHRRFLFAFGWTCHELNDQRTEYYLSGPRSVLNGFDSLLAMSWCEGPNTSPALQITLENGATYAVTWVPGGKGPQMTRIQ